MKELGTIYINGEIGVDTTLVDVIKQVKAQSFATEYLVKIDSIGGYVNVGKDIYNYLKNLDKPVTTFTTKAYSIASMIFFAGTKRIIPENAENALMIHLPWMQTAGNFEEIETHLIQLKAVEDELVSFYSKILELDKNTIHSLLKQETYLNAKQAFELGFATELKAPQLAVAKLHKKNNEENNKSLMNKLTQKIDAILNKLTGVKGELVLQDATGLSISFPKLETSDTPAKNDVAKINEKDADGEFTMPDGVIYKFEKGVLTQIIAPVEEEKEEEVVIESVEKDEIIQELQTKIEELQTKIEELLKIEDSVKMLEMFEQQIEKQNELEAKYNVLAKQVGSNFSSEKNEIKTNVQAKNNLTRAAQILNS